MTKNLIWLFCLLLIPSLTKAQDSLQVEDLYENAIELYEQKEYLKAIEVLEKVVNIKPRHKDATFNLALMHLEAGNEKRGIDLLQTGVKLHDRAAADYLKQKLHQPIAHADTMFIEDVDVKPSVIVRSRQEEMVDAKGLNQAIAKHIIGKIKMSKILQKEVVSETNLILSLFISKKGELNAAVLGTNANMWVQEEISRITKSFTGITPAKHDGKEVVVWGWVLPIRM